MSKIWEGGGCLSVSSRAGGGGGVRGIKMRESRECRAGDCQTCRQYMIARERIMRSHRVQPDNPTSLLTLTLYTSTVVPWEELRDTRCRTKHLINDNCDSQESVIHTDRSALQHEPCAWAMWACGQHIIIIRVPAVHLWTTRNATCWRQYLI